MFSRSMPTRSTLVAASGCTPTPVLLSQPETIPARSAGCATPSRYGGSSSSRFTYERFAQPAIARLDELKLNCREELIEAELALGRDQQLIPELEAFVREQPLRERARGQLMLALYRCGRQAEALEDFREARQKLIDELGVEPGAALRELHEAILRQDPSLDGPVPPSEGTRAARGQGLRARARVCSVGCTRARER